MAEEDDREVRQLRLMEDRLSAFARGEVPIGRTISDLRGLQLELEQPPQEWRQLFIESWGELEIAYAAALDRGTPAPDAKDPALREAVERMIALVDERIALTD